MHAHSGEYSDREADELTKPQDRKAKHANEWEDLKTKFCWDMK